MTKKTHLEHLEHEELRRLHWTTVTETQAGCPQATRTRQNSAPEQDATTTRRTSGNVSQSISLCPRRRVHRSPPGRRSLGPCGRGGREGHLLPRPSHSTLSDRVPSVPASSDEPACGESGSTPLSLARSVALGRSLSLSRQRRRLRPGWRRRSWWPSRRERQLMRRLQRRVDRRWPAGMSRQRRLTTSHRRTTPRRAAACRTLRRRRR